MSSSEAFRSTPRVLYGSFTAGIVDPRSRRDHHPRGPDDDVVGPVSLLDDVQHYASLRAVLLAHRECLVHRRVEPIAGRLDRLDAVALQHAPQLRQDEPPALAQRVVGVGGRLERPLEVVDDGEQLADDADPRATARGRDVLRGPLAVVLEVRLRPLREVEEFVAFAPNLLERINRLAAVRVRLGLSRRRIGAGGSPVGGRPVGAGLLNFSALLTQLVAHGVFVGSRTVAHFLPSPSTTSASTTSSSPAPAPPPFVAAPSAPACCCAAAAYICSDTLWKASCSAAVFDCSSETSSDSRLSRTSLMARSISSLAEASTESPISPSCRSA